MVVGVLALLFCGGGSVSSAAAYPYVLLPGQESNLRTLTYHGETYQVLVDASGSIIPTGAYSFHMPGYTPLPYYSPSITVDFVGGNSCESFANGVVYGDGSFDGGGDDGPFAPFESYLLARLIADMCAQ